MTIDRIVLVFAATMVLAGTLLALAVSQWFLIVPLLVGTNLLQAQFTRFCPLAMVLRAAGVQRGVLFR